MKALCIHKGIIKYRNAAYLLARKDALEHVDKLGYLSNGNWNIGFLVEDAKIFRKVIGFSFYLTNCF